MISPYLWQENIIQRAQYIENRLRIGSPVIGLSIEEGLLLYSYRGHVRKVYEIYDKLMFSALGAQADVEALRITAVDFAHQEGYARSETDVTIGRLVGFALSSPLKRAFGDMTTAPFVINALFAELNESPAEDLFFTLRYDGDFETARSFSVVAGTREAEERAMRFLQPNHRPNLSLKEAVKLADSAWRIAADVDLSGEPEPELLRGTRPEAGFLVRHTPRERKFLILPNVGELLQD
ncbi:MAG TPA: hypothetical protein VNK96_06095 [Fimbriimonadales bacterium]|nr:hypothetical protein [Fimbriimonadales bacterium]